MPKRWDIWKSWVSRSNSKTMDEQSRNVTILFALAIMIMLMMVAYSSRLQ
ncbi:MAG: hypothetical protein JWM58_3656 [Rhizobium sp.]|nr:hypothetical protein [Rhizobium sp.]